MNIVHFKGETSFYNIFNSKDNMRWDRITSTYCKNFDVLFAALWKKLSILSQNRGNLEKKSSYCPIMSVLPRWCLSCHVDVSLAMLKSLLPHFPTSRRSCHICDIDVSLATFVKIVVAIATIWKLGFPLQRSP